MTLTSGSQSYQLIYGLVSESGRWGQGGRKEGYGLEMDEGGIGLALQLQPGIARFSSAERL
jgi:hypothetical protein